MAKVDEYLYEVKLFAMHAVVFFNYFKILSFIILFQACNIDDRQSPPIQFNVSELSDIEEVDGGVWVYEGIRSLEAGDIIVRPNINLLPGTAFVPNGRNFGHAAIVTQGSTHADPDSMMAGAMIFESHAKRVDREFQLREIEGIAHHERLIWHNDSFDTPYAGTRYRLRLNIPQHQKDSIIAFVRAQQGSYSNWNAMKRFPDMPFIEEAVENGYRLHWADNTHWYCSLLIWQAVFYVTGIDIDPNGGYYAYPNDLIKSPHFDNKPGFVGRARF